MKASKAKRTPARTRKLPPEAAALPAIDKAPLSAFRELESPIRDLERAANVAFLMTMRDGECDNDSEDEPLALFAVEQVERHAAELCKQFYRAFEGKAVQS
jgi:hypothetical protein